MRVKLLIAVVLFNIASVCGAEADGPDFWKVSGIQLGSHLNIRKGPSVQFNIVSKIPADFRGIKNLGCFPEFTALEWERFSTRENEVAIGMRWCRVSFKGETGWVAGRYLTEN